MKFYCYNYIRGLIHIRDVEIERFNRDYNNSDLRVSYLLHEITLDDMKRKLQQREKKMISNTAQLQLFQMIFNVGCDLLQKLLTLKKQTEVDALEDELVQLRVYFNTCMKSLSRRHLDESWYVILTRK